MLKTTSNNRCGYWSCNKAVTEVNHFLCPMHYSIWVDGFLDRCPKCGRFKHKGWRLCEDCHSGQVIEWWEPSVPIPLLEEQCILEHSDSWEEGDKGIQHFYVYILRLSDGSFYPGNTNNPTRRMYEHSHGLVKSTVGMKPQLCYIETQSSRELATSREAMLKGILATDPLKIYDIINSFQDSIRKALKLQNKI